jgi:hypothetical protein
MGNVSGTSVQGITWRRRIGAAKMLPSNAGRQRIGECL